LNIVVGLKAQPIYKLNKMVSVPKLLVKLESLRKEFIAFGSISAVVLKVLVISKFYFLKAFKRTCSKIKT
jgi:hypothetical protein